MPLPTIVRVRLPVVGLCGTHVEPLRATVPTRLALIVHRARDAVLLPAIVRTHLLIVDFCGFHKELLLATAPTHRPSLVVSTIDWLHLSSHSCQSPIPSPCPCPCPSPCSRAHVLSCARKGLICISGNCDGGSSIP